MKNITIAVKMSGYVYQTIQVEDDFVLTEETANELVDTKFDFGQCDDITENIEWKLKNAEDIVVSDNDNHLRLDL